MSNNETEPLDVADDFTSSEAGDYEPADEWSGPTQAEWSQVTEALGHFSNLMQQGEDAERQAWESQQQSAINEMLDPLSEHHDPERAIAFLLEQHLAPVQAELAERQQADALVDAEDLADSILLEAGVSEEALDETYQAATELFPQIVEHFARQHQGTYQDIQRNYGPDAARQWAAEFARNLAVYSLKYAASSFQQQNSRGDERSVLNRWFGDPSSPRQPRATGRDEMSLVADYSRR